jgi:hypothetical protein
MRRRSIIRFDINGEEGDERWRDGIGREMDGRREERRRTLCLYDRRLLWPFSA